MKKRKRWAAALLTAATLVLAVLAGTTAANWLLPRDYDSLDSTGQSVLAELERFCAAGAGQPLWPGFELERAPLLLVDGRLGSAYLVNPERPPESLFAVEIQMPEGSPLRVYRVALPGSLGVRIAAGDFNTVGKPFRCLGGEVYFLRYQRERSLEQPYSSGHFITLLAHEAFHYYMQNNWPGGGRFAGELSEGDVDLLERQYEILSQISLELEKRAPSRQNLLDQARDYVAAVEARIEANPGYLRQELAMETAEGTAQYVGILASERVGYDFGVMYFDNVKSVPFDQVIPTLRAGKIEASFLADRMPYETGAPLCQLMEALELPGWREELNGQSPAAPRTLFQVLRDRVEQEA